MRVACVRLVSFNPFRTLEIPSVPYFKPELLFRHIEEVRAADCVLFPEYWQVNALVYGLKKPIFPSPASYHLGHDKVEMTRALLSVCPAHVPRTEILASTEANRARVLEEFDFPFVAKEVRNSMGQGVHLIQEPGEFLAYALANPVLYVQEYLPIDRDLRVVVVGDQVVTAYWRIAAPGSFHNNLAQGAEVSFEAVPPEVTALVMRIATSLGIDHAGFDVALVGGHPYFLEFNVLFGNRGLAERGVRLGEVILDYLRRRFDLPVGPEHSPPRVPPLAA